MRRSIVVFVLFAVVAGGPAHAQRAPSVGGRDVSLELLGRSTLSGELLAVQRDTVWLLERGGLVRVLPLPEVSRALVPQGGFTSRKAVTWSLIGGLVSGAALAAACSSIDAGGCGDVGVGVFVSWLAIGGISAAMSGSSMRSVESHELKAYARFPQGLPEAFVPPEP